MSFVYSTISRGISTSWVSAVTNCHRFVGPESSVHHFLQISQITFLIVVQFTLGTVVDGTRWSWATETSLEGRQFALKSCRLLTQEFLPLLGQGLIYDGADTSYMKASLRKMSAVRDKRAGVSSIARWMVKGKRATKSTQLVVAVNVGTTNDINHLGVASISYVSEHVRDLDVTFFRSWLQGITNKTVEKCSRGLFGPCSCFPIWDLTCGEVLNSERG